MVDLPPSSNENTLVSPLAPTAPGPYKIKRTHPDVLNRHDISDEELTNLAGSKRDYLWEGKWVALGVFLGVAPACVDELWDAYGKTPGEPLSIGDLFQVVVFFGALVAFLILRAVMKRKTSEAGGLERQIRARTAMEV